jgi:uncharacterized protein YndB with AHSA1/START domain
MKLRARVGAPIERVRHALTDAEAMRTWLAEYAEVDLPRTYSFWGRYTPEGDEPHQRPLHFDSDGLRFAWLLGGEETTVQFGLEAESASSTVVSLTQSHVPVWSDAVADPGVRSVLATFWALAVSNLVDFLTGRELTPKCDFTSHRLSAELLISAPPARVFSSLIDPDQFRQWFGVNLDIEPHVGGRLAMRGFDADPTAAARIVELVPDRRLSVDWGSIVETWELRESEGRTRLTFVQSGFDEDRPPYAGWTGSLGGIGELRRFHELPGWRPTWLQFGLPGTPDGMLTSA